MSEFTTKDAEKAGWNIVHEGIDEREEGATLNASHWRAEKYQNNPGRAGGFVEVAAPTEERLMEAIAMREQQFATSDEGDVLVPTKGSGVERITEEDVTRGNQNDSLLVLSDPEDPDSDSEQLLLPGDNQSAGLTLSQNLMGTQETVVQPGAGQATHASDSEQQSQVPDSEAAESDKMGTNDPKDRLPTNRSQKTIKGPATPGKAPAGAPNAQPNASNTTSTGGRVKVEATDAAREQARQARVKLSEVEGTGKDGRVTASDVQQHGK